MQVVHLNVRLSEGGAARVALDLHLRQLGLGVTSKFFYGYGAKLRDSHLTATVPEAYRLTGPVPAFSNFLTHRLIGREFVPPVGNKEHHFWNALDEADIVHLHVVHSYFSPYDWLVPALVSKKKKVVWTAHDHWLVTGRCAFTDGCDAWKDGCGRCKSTTNYPPSLIDISQFEASRKRKLLGELGRNLRIITPSHFIAKDFKNIFPEDIVTTIPNGLDIDFEQMVCNGSHRDRDKTPNSELKILVIANDLSYRAKTDRALIDRLIESQICQVHTVGKNSPFSGENVVNHGPISERSKLHRIIRDTDAMVFSSQVDSFGLVMIECLVLGVPVLATESQASVEVLRYVQGKPLEPSEIIDIVQSGDVFGPYNIKTADELAKNAMNSFSGSTCVLAYLKEYANLMA